MRTLAGCARARTSRTITVITPIAGGMSVTSTVKLLFSGAPRRFCGEPRLVFAGVCERAASETEARAGRRTQSALFHCAAIVDRGSLFSGPSAARWVSVRSRRELGLLGPVSLICVRAVIAAPVTRGYLGYRSSKSLGDMPKACLNAVLKY